MTNEEQLQAWVEGRPIHNDELDQCCPDFSCCSKGLLVDVETRKAFAVADEELRMSFLGVFLSKAFSTTASGLYLVGFDESDQTLQ